MTYQPLAKVLLSQRQDGLIYSAAAIGKVLHDLLEILLRDLLETFY